MPFIETCLGLHQDGVDIDYEDFNAFNGGTAEAWLISFTTQLYNKLGPNYISKPFYSQHHLRILLLNANFSLVTHAPVAPWFTDEVGTYPGGGYLHIDQQVGKYISWYNVQFYKYVKFVSCSY